jgi:hypothetical protein
MNTIYLIPETWDLAIDANNNIAMATDTYSMVQDAASAIQTYLGEAYFDTLKGIPYFQEILGNGLPLNLYRAYCIQAALTVPGVIEAQVFFTSIENRILTGQVQIKTQSGETAVTQFGIINNEFFRLDVTPLDNAYYELA